MHAQDPNERLVTVAFSGYRPQKLFSRGYDPLLESNIRQELHSLIYAFYDGGYRTFISGMAPGFDMWAAQTVADLKQSGLCPGIRLVAAIPFPQQADSFYPGLKRQYQNLLNEADEVRILYPKPHRSYYLRRNDYMIKRSSVLVCYYDGKEGGTAYTYRRAVMAGMEIINVYIRLGKAGLV